MTETDCEEVPSITCVEPVYPEGSETSFWVSCEAVWKDGQFYNHEAEDGWVLDEHAFLDSVYIVGDEEYASMEEAIRAALGAERYEALDETPGIWVAPQDDAQPEWGAEV